MEITCKIIQDLLPLYAEQMLSEESVQLVEEHIAECEECAKMLEELRQPSGFAAEDGAADEDTEEEPLQKETMRQKLSFQKISKEIKHRRWLSVAFGVLVTATVLIGAFCWLYRPQYLTAEEAIIGVTEEDGSVMIELVPDAYFVAEEVDSETGKELVTLTASRRRGELSLGNNTKIHGWDVENKTYIELEKKTGKQLHFDEEKVIWYADTNNPAKDVLLFGEETDGHRTTSVWKGMGVYWVFCLTAAVAFGLCGFLFRKKSFGKIFARVAVFFVCFALSLHFSTGGSLLIYDTQDLGVLFAQVTVLAGLMTGSIVFGERLYEIQK